jgi:hypothetical protein
MAVATVLAALVVAGAASAAVSPSPVRRLADFMVSSLSNSLSRCGGESFI